MKKPLSLFVLAVPVALAALSMMPLPAAAGIDDLAGTKPGDLAFPTFADADSCKLCHGGGVQGDTSFLPADTWAGTMMGNAARDPVFFAALTVANQDLPGVGTYCLRCHSPIAFVRGHATPPDGSAFDAIDKQGIGCATCHRMTEAPAPNGPYLLGDAQIYYDDNQAVHGPYATCDVNDPLSSCSPAHETLYSASLSDSRFCGQCHQVTNPEVHLLDALGMDTGVEFPLDTTYEEWEKSAYSAVGTPAFASCIDCHMIKKQGAFPVTSIGGTPDRTDPRKHTFVGGNHWGIEAVMVKNPDRVMKYPAAFDLAKQSTLESLAGSVKVTLTGAPAQAMPGDVLTLKVKAENLTGHKFPTGYAESRRAWIAVGVTDASMNDTVLVGAYDAATGTIQANPPTRVYRAVHGQWNGTMPVAEEHLANHDSIVSDTRIPPLGFIPSLTTMPTPEIDYGDGQGGVRNFDEATFMITLPAGLSGAIDVWAKVLYQSMTKEYIDFLVAANTTDSLGQELASIYDQTGKAPPLPAGMAKVTVMLPAGTSSSSSGGGMGGMGGAGGSSSAGAGGGGGEDGGCGCRVVGVPDEAPSAWIFAAISALIAARRRRR